MNFCSDNVTGIAPDIIAALLAANEGAAMPYGNDPWTQRLTAQFCDLFETEVMVFPVATGSAANALALSVMTPPFGAIYCHADSHINADECGAPELYTGGAKLIPLAGEHGKLRPSHLQQVLDRAGAGVVHHIQPAAVSITQATEAGTVYEIEEVQSIASVAQSHHLYLHMDGARFANAIVHLGCRPAEITWKAGVDVLSFGATKNGALAAEAVVFFNRSLADTFAFRRKRGGHLFSKLRFLSAQLSAYLTDHLWLRQATHANQMAITLAEGLKLLPGVQLSHPVEANEVFIWLPDDTIHRLYNAGFQFYRWQEALNEAGQTGAIVRLVTAFNTQICDVEAFITTASAPGPDRPQPSLSQPDSGLGDS
ncbi:MAG: low specificity L-threonine aldolase [Leptolyngbyaceae cyanobacterium bins.59]|nr:low specificity L-threonine aldolase [Leptolyngbyaceae cyanobacterium bins.59]